MLTFTHTFLINLAHQKLHHSSIPPDKAEIILGNVIPDFLTHLARDPYQAMAHDLSFLSDDSDRSQLEWGAIFHILCDNYSTLNRIVFQGNYYDWPKSGFIEKMAEDIALRNPVPGLPKRRILQCALDMLVLRDSKHILIDMLKCAQLFLRDNYLYIVDIIRRKYGLNEQVISVGLDRFSKVYSEEFIETAATEEYRLFPIIRSYYNLPSLTEPNHLLEKLNEKPELMLLVEENLPLIEDSWRRIFDEMVHGVLEFHEMKNNI